MLENFISAGLHIGMKQRTKDMKRFIYKIRPDGLAILDTKAIEERIALAAKFLSRFKKVMVVSRKTNGQKPIVKFSQAVSSEDFFVKRMPGRFLPGTLTNPSFKEYFEPDVVMVTDPLADAQVVKEAVKMRIPVVALCNTFNETRNIDLILPANNKGRKALALVYCLLAKEILKIQGKEELKAKPEDFESEERGEE